MSMKWPRLSRIGRALIRKLLGGDTGILAFKNSNLVCAVGVPSTETLRFVVDLAKRPGVATLSITTVSLGSDCDMVFGPSITALKPLTIAQKAAMERLATELENAPEMVVPE